MSLYKYCLRQSCNAPMVMGRTGLKPILLVKRSVTIGTIINFDGHGDSTCKQALNYNILKVKFRFLFATVFDPCNNNLMLEL